MGLRVFWGHGVESSFSSCQPPQPSTVPGVCFVLGCGSAVVLFQASRLFSLPSLFSPHCLTGGARHGSFNSLWSSFHLENEATAIHCGYISSSSLTHMHTHKHTHFNSISIDIRRCVMCGSQPEVFVPQYFIAWGTWKDTGVAQLI